MRSLFGIIFTVVQYTYFYPNGFDSKFNCNLPPAEVTSNINTPKVSRDLNSTSVNCENATASEKWLWGIIVSVINIIVALIILGEVIYLLPRLPMFHSRSGVGWSCDSQFVIEYLLGKQYNVPGEIESLTSIENNPPHCSTQDYNTPDSVAQACSTVNDSIQDTRNQDTPNPITQECTTMDNDIQESGTEDYIAVYKKRSRSEYFQSLTSFDNLLDCRPSRLQDYSASVAQACSTMNVRFQDSRNQDTPDSIVQECTTKESDIQDSGTEDCINFYKKQVLNRSRVPGIIYGPNANIDDLYTDVVIHTGRAQYRFFKQMKRHEIYDIYMKVPPESICLKEIRDLFYPNEDTKGEFPRSILAIGRPGIGKTVLAQKILRDWANGIDKYYSDRIVFFFKFRWFNENINKLTNISLKTFLRFGTELSEENFESIYEEIAREPQKAILIFDGLDEYHGDPISCLDQSRIIPDPNTGTSAINLFITLVLGDLLKGATVVVTSRPTADDFCSRLGFDRNVEIIGFTSDRIEKYVSQFCHNNNTSDLETKIWNHIKSSSELLNLCYIPVNCCIVCHTLSGCLTDPRNYTSALPTTLTEVYQTIIDHLEKHHHRNADINSTAHEALKKLQRLAFLGMENELLVFNRVLFDEQMKTSGLLNSLSNPILPLQTQFCFIHLTIQEFLAARHVTETFSPPEIKKFISDHVKSGKWHLVLQFIGGLLGKKIDREYKDCVFAFAESFEVTCGRVEVHYHEVFIMKCLREADNEEITKEVCEAPGIKDLVKLEIGTNLSPTELAAVTFVCKHMEELANLKLSALTADCLPQILGLLRKICLNKLEMALELYGRVADELDQVFSALTELNCTFDHEHTELTTLTLYNFELTEAGLPIMCNFFENGHARQLEELALQDIDGLQSHGISKLCEVLNNGHCPNLTHLKLGYDTIRDEGVMVLCDTLTKGLCKLNTLDFDMCGLTVRCIPALVKALQDERCQLTVLLLPRNNAIGDEGACMLFENALTKKHCNLTVLDLRDCSLTDRCIPSLCKVLLNERCKLTKLCLRSNKFSVNGKRPLVHAKDVRCGFTNGNFVFDEEPMDQGEFFIA